MTVRLATQANRILAALQQGERLTPLDALDRFGCFRLASRISEIKKAGHPVTKRMVSNPDGKSWAEYWLEPKSDTVSDLASQ